MKSQFALAWYHFRMFIGLLFAAIATAILPASRERRALIEAVEPFEWETK